MDAEIFPLVPGAILPQQSPAAVRARVPAGYGVQEQCLPFTAAAALGLLIGAPFAFGLCLPDEAPTGAHAFRSPLDAPPHADPRRFYVVDAPDRGFARNALALTPIPFRDSAGTLNQMNPLQPGISFFDRADQQDLFKLHLPFVLRTPSGIDTLFTAPVNRAAPFAVVAGLVETDWFPHPVNLVLKKPQDGAVHVMAGDIVAHAIFVGRDTRRPTLSVQTQPSKEAGAQRNALLKWYIARARNRSAYKRLARSRHGRLDHKEG
ncbi:DUF6065 family protein [Vineibacter terrae]|uniref:DUF6065 family protein n=1 Tax=Vineibacter terrae TaxID=2586908 RepID=UPI002E32BB5E|nr:DUF6065 family protein [Vineibacter terrae]HEX2887100.1 DUF6065 family protein [Vineibacter terrae]